MNEITETGYSISLDYAIEIAVALHFYILNPNHFGLSLASAVAVLFEKLSIMYESNGNLSTNAFVKKYEQWRDSDAKISASI